MTTKLYITKEYLYPLQMKIYEIIVQSNLSTMTESGSTDFVVQATTRGAIGYYRYHDCTNFDYLSITSKTLHRRYDGRCGKRIERGISMKKY